MAKKTKFSIKVSFNRKVPVKYVASAKLQKFGPRSTKTLGATRPHVTVDWPEMEWDEKKSATTLTLAIKKVTAEIVYSADVLIDAAIDKQSDCYKHVVQHENRHVQFWRDGVLGYRKFIVKMVAAATKPQMGKPTTVEFRDAAKFKADSSNRINEALNAAAKKYGKLMNINSKVIHTSAEMEKTNSVCAAYL